MTAAVPPATAPRIAKGTPAFARVRLALFLAGFASFALIYCVQPLLPAFSRTFQVSPGESSLALSLTTGALAGAIMAMAGLSQRLGRKAVMAVSIAPWMVGSAAAFAPQPGVVHSVSRQTSSSSTARVTSTSAVRAAARWGSAIS